MERRWSRGSGPDAEGVASPWGGTHETGHRNQAPHGSPMREVVPTAGKRDLKKQLHCFRPQLWRTEGGRREDENTTFQTAIRRRGCPTQSVCIKLLQSHHPKRGLRRDMTGEWKKALSLEEANKNESTRTAVTT